MKILVIRSGAIGDTILTLPAILAIRAHYSDADITLVANPRLSDLLVPRLASRLISADSAWLTELYTEPVSFQRLSPAFATILQATDQSIVWARQPDNPISRSLTILGIPTLGLPSFPPIGNRTSIALHLLQTLYPFGIDSSSLALDPLAASGADQTKQPASDRPIAVHPGSGSPQKNWSPNRFADLIRSLRESGRSVTLLGGPADEEPFRAVLHLLGEDGKNVGLAALNPTSIARLCEALARCQAYVGNDSGVTHLAAALGLPTVAIFGPTDPVVWRPVGSKVVILWKPDDEDASAPPFPTDYRMPGWFSDKVWGEKALGRIGVADALGALRSLGIRIGR